MMYPHQGIRIQYRKNEDEPINSTRDRSLGKNYDFTVGPDYENAARDLARCISNSREEHRTVMGRLVGYIK